MTRCRRDCRRFANRRTASQVWLILSSAALVLTLAGCAGGGVIDVTFLAPATNTDGSPLTDLNSYRVYYGTTEHPCPGGRPIVAAAPKVQVPANQLVRVRLTGLAVGTHYYVAVTAVNSRGIESECTETRSAPARPANQN